MNLATVEIKAFVPARNFELSKRFYRDLGFEIPWSSDDLAYLHAGNASFLLQMFYNREHAGNFMMHLLVEDVDAWWRHVVAQQLVERYGVRAGPPEDRPWAIRDFTLTDPTGVVWRIGQNIPAAKDTPERTPDKQYPSRKGSLTMSNTRPKFESTSLSGALFHDVNLRSSSFDDVALADASFSNVSFNGAKFTNVDLRNVEISDANLAGMTINGILVADLLRGKTP